MGIGEARGGRCCEARAAAERPNKVGGGGQGVDRAWRTKRTTASVQVRWVASTCVEHASVLTYFSAV